MGSSFQLGLYLGTCQAQLGTQSWHHLLGSLRRPRQRVVSREGSSAERLRKPGFGCQNLVPL